VRGGHTGLMSATEITSPATEIVPCVDGPLLVRGDFALVSPDGEPIDARRGTVALCRCGKSAIRPFCDGTHKLIGFRAPGEREQ